MELDEGILGSLTPRGILAYVAVKLAGDSIMTTASLAALVRCQSGHMLEGLKDIEAAHPTVVKRIPKNRWACGKPTPELAATSQGPSRYAELVEDLQTYWTYLNPQGPPFSFSGRDGAACRRVLTENPAWERQHWQVALRFRIISVARYSADSKTSPIFSWIGKLGQFAAGPMNQYGKPVEGSGKHGQTVEVERANRQAIQSFLGSDEGASRA